MDKSIFKFKRFINLSRKWVTFGLEPEFRHKLGNQKSISTHLFVKYHYIFQQLNIKNSIDVD
jgi:hypothetical protein